ncbi:MAG: carboxylesterase family protein [Alphaproteobacteria bacterium]|nr:carboxylesterase family protein [Alphaproteobacteria bacterium]
MSQSHPAGSAQAANPIANTQGGRVRGVTRADAHAFLGVPYAAAPVGALRFAAPQPHAPWDGVRDAVAFGPVAPQPTPSPEDLERVLPGVDIAPLVGSGWIEGDDYLVANIWTPDTSGQAPVMVFIHGGAFTGGAGSAAVYDGSAFALRGVVLVTINYRLGIEGFLPIEGAPTNLGLRDQIAALHWVQANIAGFGGDPTNVTVFGESAGAMSVANLLASPLAHGLFRRAIVQSGHGSMVRPIPVAQRLTARIAKLLRIPPTIDGFRSRSVAECLAAQAKVSLPTTRINLRDADRREPAFGLSRFLPVFGDDVLPQKPLDALADGMGADVDLLIGSNTEEMNLYFVPSGVRGKIGGLLARFIVGAAEPQAGRILRAYGMGAKGKRAGDAFTEALTDLVFRLPARRFARAHQGRTHVYAFGWRSPIYDNQLGACHAIELPFAFDTLSTVRGPRGLAGDAPPQALAERMNAIWCAFAESGALPWPEYCAPSFLEHRLDTDETATEPPMPAERFI